MANSSISTAIILQDIIVNADDFKELPSPVLLDRNFTIRGNGRVWPCLDFNYTKGKVQLLNGAALHLVAVTLLRVRSKPINLAPGLDLLLPSPPGSGTMLVVLDGLLVVRSCFPIPYMEYNFAGLKRPPGFGGPQQRLIRNVSQAGCVTDPGAHPAARCWPERGRYADVVMDAVDVSEDDRQLLANYVIVLTNEGFVCSKLISNECMETQTPLACVTQALGGLRALAPPPLPMAGAGGWSSRCGKDKSSCSHSVWIPALVGGLGGAALIALAGVTFWALSRRRCLQPYETRSPQSPAAGGKQQQQHLLLAATGGDVRVVHSDSSGAQSSEAAEEEADAAGDAGDSKAADAAASELAGSPAAGDTESEVLLHDLGAYALEAAAGAATAATAPMPSEAPAAVSHLTPPRADLAMGVQCGNEVKLEAITLGKGSYGRVVVGTYREERVAVKLLLLLQGDSGLELSGVANSRDRLGCLSREVEVLGRCRHPNVVRLLAACLEPPQPCLVMELMETSLARLLYGTPGKLLPLNTVLHIALDIARGLEFLHPTILHRDLKPANVLIDGATTSRPVAKIADFGLSRLVASVLITKHPGAGTPSYMAPECFDPDNFEVTHKADIYSLGVILAEMLSGCVPWQGLTLMDLVCQVALMRKRPLLLQGLSPDRCPRKLHQLVEDCWDQDPMRRPAAAEVVKKLMLVQQQVLARTPTAATAELSL